MRYALIIDVDLSSGGFQASVLGDFLMEILEEKLNGYGVSLFTSDDVTNEGIAEMDASILLMEAYQIEEAKSSYHRFRQAYPEKTLILIPCCPHWDKNGMLEFTRMVLGDDHTIIFPWDAMPESENVNRLVDELEKIADED